MFRGINCINLDTKARLAIPTRYRECLQKVCEGQLILTIDTQVRCLLLYPLPEWEQIEKKLQLLPTFNAEATRIKRLLIGHATELKMDDHGRILIPAEMREYIGLSGLNNKMMLVGQINKFELWAEEEWEIHRKEWLAKETMNLDALPDAMRSLSL